MYCVYNLVLCARGLAAVAMQPLGGATDAHWQAFAGCIWIKPYTVIAQMTKHAKEQAPGLAVPVVLVAGWV